MSSPAGTNFRTLALNYMLDRDFFDPLAGNENVLPGRHAYSHAIALSSAAKAYLVLGDEKYRRAMANAWTYLTTQQQFASGGWGPNEQFVTPHQGKLYESLSTTVDHFETPCGAYAASKLDRYLLCMTGDARYGDHLERVVYNTRARGQAAGLRRRLPLLLDLWPECDQGLVPEQVALLLGHAGAGRCRLRPRFVSARR